MAKPPLPVALSVSTLDGIREDNATYFAVKAILDQYNSLVGYIRQTDLRGTPPTGPLTVTAAAVNEGIKLTWQDEGSGSRPSFYQVWSAAAGTVAAPTTPLFSAAVRIAKVPATNPGGKNTTFYPTGSVYTWFDQDFVASQVYVSAIRRTYWLTTVDDQGNESIPIQATSSPIAVAPWWNGGLASQIMRMGAPLGVQTVGWSTFPIIGSIALVNGANNNVDVLGADTVYITGPTGVFNITGVTSNVSGTVILVNRLTLTNTTTQTMTITNQSAASTAGNRITCQGGVDLVLAGSGGSVTLDKLGDSLNNPWRVVAKIP